MEIGRVKLLDTNVIVRTIMQDVPDQAQVAFEELSSGPVLVPLTILMEVEWVLRSRYKMARHDVNNALRNLLLIEHVSTDNAILVQQALDRHEAGADFADMIHTCAAPDADEFVTFDKALAKSGVPGGMVVRVVG